MDTKQIVEAVKELAAAKSISEEDVGIALEEAFQKAYLKLLGGGDDAEVYCHVNTETGEIQLGQMKDVVEEVEDDYLQIEPEEARAINPDAKPGDRIAIPANLEELNKAVVLGVKNNLRQRLAEAERSALYAIYKDHIGEMVVGTVEKADDRNVFVNIGRTTVELTKRELIGDEYFKVGDTIKVYIQEVKSADDSTLPNGKKRGPQIEATRSSEGFLKRLFEEEIHEIYDGTVVIKAIARQAGVRSKVAVISKNEDVDATGACIGAGGSRIQKIVGQLGNGKNKEKIDIINYSDYAPLFVIEAVRPAQALGVAIDEENKIAKVIIPNENVPFSMGKYRANQNLAGKLTGYKIEFVPENEAEGLDYVTAEMAAKLAEEHKRLKEREEYARKSLEEARKREEARLAEEARRAAEEEAARKAAEEEARRAAEEAASKKGAPAPKTAPVVTPITPAVPPKASANPEEFPAEAINPAAAALAAVAEEKRRKEEEARRAAEEPKPVEEKKEEAEEPVIPAEVKTTTTLSELEAELEEAKERASKKPSSSKRPRKITEEEVKREPIKPSASTGMAIYTEEELAAMKEEEENDIDLYDLEEESDIDEEYNEYDRYYDDEN